MNEIRRAGMKSGSLRVCAQEIRNEGSGHENAKVNIPVVMRFTRYMYLCGGENPRLGGDAAAGTAGASTIGVDGSGRRGLRLGGRGGDGEEGSEEIH
jgi:hypothetical protein